MTDVLTTESRSYCMSRIRGVNTRPELQVRKLLFASGFRYRLNVATLAGKPDLVFPKYNAVLFVHGCFWHGHRCHLFRWPAANQEFWRTKITGNVTRDERAREALAKAGWRVGVVWECALKGTSRLDMSDLLRRLESWLAGDLGCLTIPPEH